MFHGLGTALVTPFARSGAVDLNTYATLVDRQVSAGVDFLVPLATTSETPTLSLAEKTAILEVTKEHSLGRPLLVGCGSNSLTGTLENMRLLEPYGADAWLVVVPFYNKPNQEGQYQYFRAVAERSEKPIVIYNVPGRTGSNMSAQTVARLAADCPNIVGIKEASGNYAQVSDIIRLTPKGFSVMSGDDDLTLALMATGGHGLISVVSNLAPIELKVMVQALEDDDIKLARSLHHRFTPLFRACFVEPNPIPIKAGMAMCGLLENNLRLPLCRASEQTESLMHQIIQELWKLQ